MRAALRRSCSRLLGWLSDRHLPRPLRAPLFRAYARAFGLDLSELRLALADHPSFGAFFVRRLADEVRVAHGGAVHRHLVGAGLQMASESAPIMIRVQGRIQKLAGGVNHLAGADNATLLITHYQRLLDVIAPDYVHVMAAGRILRRRRKRRARRLIETGAQLCISCNAGLRIRLKRRNLIRRERGHCRQFIRIGSAVAHGAGPEFPATD